MAILKIFPHGRPNKCVYLKYTVSYCAEFLKKNVMKNTNNLAIFILIFSFIQDILPGDGPLKKWTFYMTNSVSAQTFQNFTWILTLFLIRFSLF